ncbi:MAG: CgeB family protein [Cytophaga sp.]|uniref:CgeB family protein n=1 Tax=Cytophaga sp. TaxID=29535 RepID=UPI003F7DE8A3
MKIIYVNSAPYKIDICLAAWKKIADDVIVIGANKQRKKTVLERIAYKLGYPLDLDKLNERLLLQLNQAEKPDLIFIVKGNTILPATLKKVASLKIPIVSWSNDDMFARHNRSRWYTRGVKWYDLVVTQKSYNCNTDELPALGARKVLFQDKSYDADLHIPCLDCTQQSVKADVLFIGTYEIERHEMMEYAASQGVVIDIYGNGWKNKIRSSNLICHEKPLYGEEFVKAISCSKISLNFLRKINRDLQTSRSIEIPACGGFMLSERSNEHERLFKENSEAVYFDSKEELVDKINYYLQHETERKKIADAGRERCLASGYSFEDRMKEIVRVIKQKTSHSHS